LAAAPAKIFTHDWAQTIMDAVDFIVEQQIPIPLVLLKIAKFPYNFERNIHKKLDGGGDEGHKFLILILNYCFQSLKPLIPQFGAK
jgi:hypothetical protein